MVIQLMQYLTGGCGERSLFLLEARWFLRPPAALASPPFNP